MPLERLKAALVLAKSTAALLAFSSFPSNVLTLPLDGFSLSARLPQSAQFPSSPSCTRQRSQSTLPSLETALFTLSVRSLISLNSLGCSSAALSCATCTCDDLLRSITKQRGILELARLLTRKRNRFDRYLNLKHDLLGPHTRYVGVSQKLPFAALAIQALLQGYFISHSISPLLRLLFCPSIIVLTKDAVRPSYDMRRRCHNDAQGIFHRITEI